ncbi:hypothetical protein HNQ82_002377 [Anoxybacillus tengchongensis]|uniref:Uncharacterized protein n=1 Tax=Anoxybacillus tengchongensis TaxID=576944 RepID=A0A7X0DA91_9BACL|nr:hypothetical protein [Anoxybacillus tengchongensis]MBB6177542.1 hypothetical protein [Anoxybacillus tengchongensis]
MKRQFRRLILVATLALTATLLLDGFFGSLITTEASTLPKRVYKEGNVTITVTPAVGSSIAKLSNSKSKIAPLDTIVRGNKEMYGTVTMTVTYDRNLTTKTSTITGIYSLENTDSYLKLIDKWYTSSVAQADYYDSFHKLYVTIRITKEECN